MLWRADWLATFGGVVQGQLEAYLGRALMATNSASTAQIIKGAIAVRFDLLAKEGEDTVRSTLF